MGSIYQEFERELEACHVEHAGNPKREIVHLLLLGLEREEIVSIAYREEIILHRLKSMPISKEVLELVRSALLWAWKDEEMHAIYIRGALFKFGGPWLKAVALGRQTSGAVAGWASSVTQHVRWSEAPLSRSIAAFVTGSGALLGRVPRHVRKHLDYGCFREYCLFNVDAERTAWLCFEHLAQLINSQPDLSRTLVEDFRRTQDDEDRHQRIFQILADVFDDSDRLVPGETADTVAERISAVGEFFLPRRRRRKAVANNPLGGGGQVFVKNGDSPDSKLVLFRQLLEESGLADRLAAKAAQLGKPAAEMKVAIKASFMLGYHRKDTSSVTDSALLHELAQYLFSSGCNDIAVVEQRNLYDYFYQNRSVRDVANYVGLSSSYYRIVDLSEEQVPHTYFRGLGQYTVGRTWKDADFRISFAKMRSHPVDIVYLTVGNFDGLGARCDEFLFVERQAHRDTATMMLMSEFPCHFALIDAYDSAGDGLLGVLGCPAAKSPRRLYAGQDAVAVDIVAARHMGISDPRQCPILKAACQWFGDPSSQTEVIGYDEPIRDWISPLHNEWSALLSLLANPVYQYSSSRGAVFVPEMDEAAFPLIEPEGWILKARRRSLQAFLGLRHKR